MSHYPQSQAPQSQGFAPSGHLSPDYSQLALHLQTNGLHSLPSNPLGFMLPGGQSRGGQWDPSEADRIQAECSVSMTKAEISTRKGPGNSTLEYVGGDVVIKNLNKVFGFNGWSVTYSREDIDIDRDCGQTNGRNMIEVGCFVNCTITLRDGTLREDVGTGHGRDAKLFDAKALAKKAAYTDGLKRAARKFGEFFGNCLYEDQPKFHAPKTNEDRQKLVSAEQDNLKRKREDGRSSCQQQPQHLQLASSSSSSNAYYLQGVQGAQHAAQAAAPSYLAIKQEPVASPSPETVDAGGGGVANHHHARAILPSSSSADVGGDGFAKPAPQRVSPPISSAAVAAAAVANKAWEGRGEAAVQATAGPPANPYAVAKKKL